MTTINRDISDDILSIIQNEGRESTSFVKSELRDKGWKGLGNNADFETMVERLGFTLQQNKKPSGDITATYITL